MIFRSRTLPGFWRHYDALSKGIRRRASKQYAIFEENPRHRCLSRVAVREGNTFTWFWIGPHDEYERILKG